MNISNVSCEYFYDEEYDIAKHEGTYNQPFLNNNFYPISKNLNQYKHEFLTTSRLWSECLLENSENNNYHESCTNLQSSLFKCVSSDNILDASFYSLSKNVPFLNQNVDNSFNYRLYFDEKESINNKNVFDIRKQFAKKYNSKIFTDSGKCSAATSESLIHPFKQYRNELANSENNLHEISMESYKQQRSIVSQKKKSSKQLWRKLKDTFSSKKILWKKMKKDNKPKRFCRSYSSSCLETLYYSVSDKSSKNNRFSTTIVELYNLLTDLFIESNDLVFNENNHSNKIQINKIIGRDVSCQCPEFISKNYETVRKSRRNIEYPGIGKINLPHKLRTSVNHLIDTDVAFANLKFLENSIESHKIQRRGNSVCQIRGRMNKFEDVNFSNKDRKKKLYISERCASESRYRHDYNNEIDNDVQTYRGLTSETATLNVIQENKSISFSDLRPIPRNWGLSKDDQILAIFEFPIRSVGEPKVIEYDDESSAKLGGLVNNAIAAIKLVSENISNIQDLTTICDKFIRCKDSNRQSTCTLLLAVDNILALISDGLSIDSLRSKKVQPSSLTNTKMTLRMWMFFEESCRSNLIKDVSHKLAFANLLKQVKQICGNTVPDQRSKEWLAHLKLQIFIVIAIKNNILHIWLRAVVVNDTILHRFFASCSFFQQARTSYSNALSAVIVEIRRLSNPDSSKLNVNKAVKGKAKHISNSSSDNSISKSRIPIPNKKCSK